MTKKEKKGKNGKKLVGSIVTIVVVIILLLALLVSSLFVIFDEIVNFIGNITKGVINGALDFIAHPFKSTIRSLYELDNFLSSMLNQDFDGTGLELTQPKQLVIINQKDFEEMEKKLDQTISRDLAGVDNVMLKKMLLVYNMGNYSKKTDIIIELTKEEYDAAKNDETLYKPFEVCKGTDIDQFELPSNIVEHTTEGLKLVTNVAMDFLTRRKCIRKCSK